LSRILPVGFGTLFFEPDFFRAVSALHFLGRIFSGRFRHLTFWAGYFLEPSALYFIVRMLFGEVPASSGRAQEYFGGLL
jgi:hypothetical protein